MVFPMSNILRRRVRPARVGSAKAGWDGSAPAGCAAASQWRRRRPKKGLDQVEAWNTHWPTGRDKEMYVSVFRLLPVCPPSVFVSRTSDVGTSGLVQAALSSSMCTPVQTQDL
jgi:hypothetical protein